MIDIIQHWYLFILALMLGGALAGFLSGLLGIGGGLVMVPIIHQLLIFVDGDLPHMKIAVATALAAIFPTGLSSIYAHYKRGNINFSMFKLFLPPIIIGAVLGTYLLLVLDNYLVQWAFAILVYCAAANLWLTRNEKPGEKVNYNIIFFIVHYIWVIFIGAISALVGIGGAVMNVPTMNFYGVEMRNAVATASSLGIFVALFSMISQFFMTKDVDIGLPLSYGYVSIPIMVTIVAISVLTAPIGARVVSSMDRKYVKIIFSIFLLVVGTKMVVS